jgi:hypothetical protein
MTKDFRNKGIDQFGRNYPDRIVLRNGDVLIGQIAVESTSPDGEYTIPIFKVIENIEDWKHNRIQYGTKSISLIGKDIDVITTYKEY